MILLHLNCHPKPRCLNASDLTLVFAPGCSGGTVCLLVLLRTGVVFHSNIRFNYCRISSESSPTWCFVSLLVSSPIVQPELNILSSFSMCYRYCSYCSLCLHCSCSYSFWFTTQLLFRFRSFASVLFSSTISFSFSSTIPFSFSSTILFSSLLWLLMLESCYSLCRCATGVIMTWIFWTFFIF